MPSKRKPQRRNLKDPALRHLNIQRVATWARLSYNQFRFAKPDVYRQIIYDYHAHLRSQLSHTFHENKLRPVLYELNWYEAARQTSIAYVKLRAYLLGTKQLPLSSLHQLDAYCRRVLK